MPVTDYCSTETPTTGAPVIGLSVLRKMQKRTDFVQFRTDFGAVVNLFNRSTV